MLCVVIIEGRFGGLDFTIFGVQYLTRKFSIFELQIKPIAFQVTANRYTIWATANLNCGWKMIDEMWVGAGEDFGVYSSLAVQNSFKKSETTVLISLQYISKLYYKAKAPKQ